MMHVDNRTGKTAASDEYLAVRCLFGVYLLSFLEAHLKRSGKEPLVFCRRFLAINCTQALQMLTLPPGCVTWRVINFNKRDHSSKCA